MKGQQRAGVAGLQPVVNVIGKRLGVHGKVDLLRCGGRHLVVELAEQAFLSEEIAVQPPEGKNRQEGDEQKQDLRILCRENKQGRDNGDAPAFEEKGVACHALDDLLDQFDVLEFAFYGVHGDVFFGIDRIIISGR